MDSAGSVDSGVASGSCVSLEAVEVEVSGALVSLDELVPQAARLRTIARLKNKAVNFFIWIVPFLMYIFYS